MRAPMPIEHTKLERSVAMVLDRVPLRPALGRAASSQPAVRSSWCQTIYVNARVHTHWRMLRPCQTVSAILYARYDCACVCVCVGAPVLCCSLFASESALALAEATERASKVWTYFREDFFGCSAVREMGNTCGRCLFQCTSCVGELLWWGGDS